MTVLTRVLGLLAIGFMAGPATDASAQSYPTKPVRMVVPFGAGGPADVYARVLAQHLTEALKQNFVVENRPGAGAIIGTEAVAKSAPDGYTLLVMSNTHTTNESLIPNRPYQLMRDFVPVSPINESDVMMVVNPSARREEPQGVHRARQVEARPAQLRVVGSGHALSHGGRAVQSDDQYRHRACPAQDLRRHAHQRAGRPRADDVRRDHRAGAERARKARSSRSAPAARRARR